MLSSWAGETEAAADRTAGTGRVGVGASVSADDFALAGADSVAGLGLTGDRDGGERFIILGAVAGAVVTLDDGFNAGVAASFAAGGEIGTGAETGNDAGGAGTADGGSGGATTVSMVSGVAAARSGSETAAGSSSETAAIIGATGFGLTAGSNLTSNWRGAGG